MKSWFRKRLSVGCAVLLPAALMLFGGPAATLGASPGSTNEANKANSPGLESAFRSANAAIAEGRYQEGADRLDALPTGGKTSAALEYNRGLARLRLGESGAARAHWLLAARLEPRNPAVVAALSRTGRDGAPVVPSGGSGPLAWTDALTLDEWGALVFIGCWTWGCLLLLGRIRPALSGPLRLYTVGCGILAVCLAGILAGALVRRTRMPDAVTLRADTVVRVSPLDEARGAFTLGEGQMVRARPSGSGWVMVEDPATGRFGWAKAGDFLRLPVR